MNFTLIEVRDLLCRCEPHSEEMPRRFLSPLQLHIETQCVCCTTHHQVQSVLPIKLTDYFYTFFCLDTQHDAESMSPEEH